MKLLSVGGNPKIAKGDGDKYLTASLTLLPDDKLCPKSQLARCYEVCLKTSGRGAMTNTTDARRRKSEWYHRDPKGFLAQLLKDLKSFSNKCKKLGVQGCVRLNVLSDVVWEIKHPEIFSMFPDLIFYDYTKIHRRVDDIRLPPNYHLTLSYSAADKRFGAAALNRIDKANVAVVFSGGLPKTFEGIQVIDGDQTDLRFTDPKGVIVGLKAKGSAAREINSFVVNLEECA